MRNELEPVGTTWDELKQAETCQWNLKRNGARNGLTQTYTDTKKIHRRVLCVQYYCPMEYNITRSILRVQSNIYDGALKKFLKKVPSQILVLILNRPLITNSYCPTEIHFRCWQCFPYMALLYVHSKNLNRKTKINSNENKARVQLVRQYSKILTIRKFWAKSYLNSVLLSASKSFQMLLMILEIPLIKAESC